MKIEYSYLGITKKFGFTNKLRKLIEVIVKEEEKKLGGITVIFITNPGILEINQKYLNHNYFTDVITFNNNRRDTIYGDIYISVDQVVINAITYKTNDVEELVRVVVHGVLHLIGYDDKSETDRIVMKKREDIYLCKFSRELTILKREFKI